MRYKAVKYALENGAVLNVFKDIKDETAMKSAAELYAKQVVNGMSFDTFSPNRAVTQEDLIVMLGRLANAAMNHKSETYGVTPNGWSSGYLIWAIENGILDKNNYTSVSDHVSSATYNAMIAKFDSAFGFDIPLLQAEQAVLTRAEICIKLSKSETLSITIRVA